VRERSDRLQEPQGRLNACYEGVLRGYQSASIVHHLGRVVEENDRTPSDFRVLSNSEARPLHQFTDTSFYWEMYCEELGRSVALGELKLIFEELDRLPPSGELDATNSTFKPLLDAIDDLTGSGGRPNVLCAPIGLFVPFGLDKGLATKWDDTGEYLAMPGRPPLRIIWSNGAAPLSQFVVFDSRAAVWRFKPDPTTGNRLTVAIGEQDSPRNAVMFLAETVAKYEIQDSSAFRAVRVVGEPLEPEEYANREAFRRTAP
jgi:hypothetical protein